MNRMQCSVGPLTVLVCLTWMVPCGAADPIAGLLACRALAAAARLACFDRETAALSAGTAVPVTTTPIHPLSAPDPKQQFGLPERDIAKQEIAAGARAPDASKIEARISQLSRTADGRAIFMLDNDQVWRQLVADADVLAKQGNFVTISRGALRSYWLQIKSGRGCKVMRVH